ncbi:hypothetical protein [Paraburkholderia bryophila]|uniref:Tail fiber protein n=1 Tax=Paraburkholderia bryophila TaxID=420952 RepID=A0A329CMC2_9BURK|nr:hypothetical protein [Paraburkholderia bryophila]RAS35869.1 hypothetical protein BX591_104199 [Paraburkholderia bryophila]
MYRIDDPTASTTLPTPEAALAEGYFTEGNPGTGTPATLERASWFNMIQEELRAIVVAAGLTPSKTTYNQVFLAIQALIKAAGQGISSTGNISTTGKINGSNNPNLLFNGSGEFGSVGWTLGSFSQFVDTSGEIGSFFSNSGALTSYTFAVAGQQVPIGPSQNVCLSMDVSNGAAGTVQISLAAYTSAGGYISNIGTSAVPNASLTRYSTTAVTPANTAYVVPQLVLNGVTSSAFGIVFRRVKVEQGTTPSLYSQEASIAGINSGRLLRTSIYTNVGGTQYVSVNGGAATTTGATTFVPLSTTNTVIGECQGAGGAGSGATGATSTTVSLGAPGASGSYGKSLWSVTAVGASQTITVGLGGAAVSGGSGNSGGSSSIGSLMTAPGGPGGTLAGTVTPPYYQGNGTAATATTGANMIAIQGLAGSPSCGIGTGASALIGGSGGATPYGQGAQGAAGNSNGQNAANFGGGGGGIALNQAGGTGTGGAGKNGIVTIQEFA